MIYNSRSLALAEHHPFRVDEYGNRQGAPSTVQIVETMSRRVRVADTDNGKNLALRVRELQELLQAYREGRITEKTVSYTHLDVYKRQERARAVIFALALLYVMRRFRIFPGWR